MFLCKLVRLRKQKEIPIFTRVMDLMKILRTGQKYSYKTREKVRTQIKPKTSSRSAFTCSKLTIETLEQGVKYVQS